MKPKTIDLIGVPMDSGKRRQGCLMGPDALRTAGLYAALSDLGHSVTDSGNVTPATFTETTGSHLHALQETIAWTKALSDRTDEVSLNTIPIFMGGDHALALGTVRGMANAAAQANRPLFVLWLDAHTDYHTPATTASGNLHGTPVGYVTGRDGFDSFPPIDHPVPHDQIAMLGLRSVDAEERAAIEGTDVTYVDMRHIDEHGIAKPLAAFLARVAQANGLLHVSLDVDFLDPSVAPAVGTTVPGGATIREAHLVMEMICDSDLLSSLDIVELNPFLDERGRTAQLMVDLAASAFGRRVFDRPTRAY
ncbi:arginase [Tateyamaria omphalii]|uniref:Arginase n=1 Tax=Tateyamaria omphalii TaxID=299262 RepID=A0A1P8MTB2_9RHOB|nr:arginase [Tateyamaria omphalii]APX11281.1 arginase [Tateyamaria omphalii]